MKRWRSIPLSVRCVGHGAPPLPYTPRPTHDVMDAAAMQIREESRKGDLARGQDTLSMAKREWVTWALRLGARDNHGKGGMVLPRSLVRDKPLVLAYEIPNLAAATRNAVKFCFSSLFFAGEFLFLLFSHRPTFGAGNVSRRTQLTHQV